MSGFRSRTATVSVAATRESSIALRLSRLAPTSARIKFSPFINSSKLVKFVSNPALSAHIRVYPRVFWLNLATSLPVPAFLLSLLSFSLVSRFSRAFPDSCLREHALRISPCVCYFPSGVFNPMSSGVIRHGPTPPWASLSPPGCRGRL